MKQTLLFAAGDAESCDLYRQFFTARGYNVAISLDGLDCVEKLRRLEPAVLVLDRELRWGGGDGVLAWLRQESPTHGIPVILTTTAACPQESVEFPKPPVVDYLPRPFTLTALLESVRFAVADTRRREPSNRRPLLACSELFIG